MADKPQDPEQDRGFKVVDRRGRASDSAAAPATPSTTAPAATARTASGASEVERNDVPLDGDEVLGPIDFSTFLVSLASSALIHLGEAQHPETNAVEVSLPHAQQTIDLLALLQEKTKGNLSDDEGKLLQALLRDLRLRFVSVTQRS